MRVRFTQDGFGRWIILHPENDGLAWSGAAWVPIGCNGFPAGQVQVSNFGTKQEAVKYIKSFTFANSGGAAR